MTYAAVFTKFSVSLKVVHFFFPVSLRVRLSMFPTSFLLFGVSEWDIVGGFVLGHSHFLFLVGSTFTSSM